MSDYLVTVCAACLTASCWHGEYMCQASRHASTKDLPASELRNLNKEHPSHFSRAKILKVAGRVREVSP